MATATPRPKLADLDPSQIPALAANRMALPLAVAVVLVACAAVLCVRHRRDGARSWAGTLAWVGVQVVALLGLTAMCAMGLIHARTRAVAVCSLVAGAMGVLALLRHEFDHGRIPHAGGDGHGHDACGEPGCDRGQVVRAVLANVLAGAVATVAAVAALELSWNPFVLEVVPQAYVVEFAFVGLAILAAVLLAQLHGGLAALLVMALCVIGLTQCFVIRFKGQPLMPADILAAGTAMAVSGGYSYTLSGAMLKSIACALLGVGACSQIRPVAGTRRPGWRRVVARVVASVACAATIGICGATLPFDDMGLLLDYWASQQLYNSYCRQGFLPIFSMALRETPIAKPDGYDAGEAAKLEAAYAGKYDETLGASDSRAVATKQFDETKPSIVFVMNESFSDLRVLGDVADGYAGPTFFSTGLRDCVQRGTLYTSVTGGGTANTEFEVLTGNSCAFVGYGKHPYAMYDLTDVSSLASELSEVGYHTVAMHPNNATNWNRDRVYKQFGFDEFRALDHYYGGLYFHSGVRDYCTYDDIIDLLQTDDRPQFVFDVTMANHGGYDKDNVPDEQRTKRTSSAAKDPDQLAQLNEYLDCIEASDEDLREFVGKLRKLDRPVLLVFFGDHQPSISTWLNDNLNTGEDDLTHQLHIYQTEYFVWANYDVAGSVADDSREDLSANYLGSRVLELAGAPLTERRRSSLALRESMPAVFPFGSQDASGAWSPLDLKKGLTGTALDAQKIQYLDFVE